jgi:arabinan endo-1,5-alpha-L-arabinosidase
MRFGDGSRVIGVAVVLMASAILAGPVGVSQTAPAGSGALPGAAAQGAPVAPNAPGAEQRRPQGPAIGVPTLGMPGVHDPSTVVRFHGQYYVYTTGRGIPFISSPDGETWTRQGSVFPQIPDAVHAAVPKNNGSDVWAPDLVRHNGEFYMYYAVSSWGSFNSAVALATNPVLDPKDPAYKWTDRGVVVSSDGVEDLNAIDPGVIAAPDGTMWICYGSYHGSIRLTQLDPKTGLALKPKTPGEVIARQSEASDIIFHDGYYYLFVNHGSCCQGKNSQYNIRVGRSRVITGPYLDRHGKSLADGEGSLFLAAHDHRIGPGHFGRLLDYDASPTTGAEADGAERFSLHYEADLTHGGRSTLDIRPLLWSVDGWPVAGDNVMQGTYQIVARESESTLEEHVPMPPKPATPAGGSGAVTPAATAAAVSTDAAVPLGPPMLRLTRYLTLDGEKWTIAPVAGGFYKLVNLATGDAIGIADGAATTGRIELGAYTGADAQMWRLETFPDGSCAIRSKLNGLALAAPGSGKEANNVVAVPFARDDLHLWTLTTP